MQKLQPLNAHMKVKAEHDPNYGIFHKQLNDLIDEAQKFIAAGYTKSYEWGAYDPAQDFLFKATTLAAMRKQPTSNTNQIIIVSVVYHQHHIIDIIVTCVGAAIMHQSGSWLGRP